MGVCSKQICDKNEILGTIFLLAGKERKIHVENSLRLWYSIVRMITLPTRWGTMLMDLRKMVDEPFAKMPTARTYIFCKAVDEPLSKMPTVSAVTALVWDWNGLVFFIFRRIYK